MIEGSSFYPFNYDFFTNLKNLRFLTPKSIPICFNLGAVQILRISDRGGLKKLQKKHYSHVKFLLKYYVAFFTEGQCLKNNYVITTRPIVKTLLPRLSGIELKSELV